MPSRALISVTGPDWRSFLQGLLTQDQLQARVFRTLASLHVTAADLLSSRQFDAYEQFFKDAYGARSTDAYGEGKLSMPWTPGDDEFSESETTTDDGTTCSRACDQLAEAETSYTTSDPTSGIVILRGERFMPGTRELGRRLQGGFNDLSAPSRRAAVGAARDQAGIPREFVASGALEKRRTRAPLN